MKSTETESFELTAVELMTATEETLEEGWFADRRSGSIPPPRRSSAPPMGDDDVDPWLR